MNMKTGLLLIWFILCQILVTKEKLPAKLRILRLRWLLLVGILMISGTIVLSALLNIGSGVVIGVTILISSLIAWKYRQKFTEMERGKQV